jgi:UDP-N-acetyl-D-glucosamine dehydrogenase
MKMNTAAKGLYSKIHRKKACVAVIGLGYVGLPLATAFVKKGFSVIGLDRDPGRIAKLRKGESYVEDVPSKDLRAAVKRGLLQVASDAHSLSQADVIIICVPTPLNRVKDPDLSYILAAAQSVRDRLREGQLIILESTTYPGTTEEVVLPELERSGLKAGKHFFLCFSPERIDPGNEEFPLTKITKVVGGITPVCTHLGSALYKSIVENVLPVSTAKTAEMAKLLENTFRIVNIGLVNELAQVADKLHIDIWEAIKAASTKPFGYMPFYPGPGIGGHCIGVDPIYLSWKAKLHGVDIHFIELARRMNAQMPRFVVERVVYALNARSKKAVSGSRILMLGVSYKRDVSDTRESPAFEIMHELKNLGAKVSYHDPYVPEIQNGEFRLTSEPLTPRTLKDKDLVIVTTDHRNVDYALVARNARLVFDTRNVQHPSFQSNNVVRL